MISLALNGDFLCPVLSLSLIKTCNPSPQIPILPFASNSSEALKNF